MLLVQFKKKIRVQLISHLEKREVTSSTRLNPTRRYLKSSFY